MVRRGRTVVDEHKDAVAALAREDLTRIAYVVPWRPPSWALATEMIVEEFKVAQRKLADLLADLGGESQKRRLGGVTLHTTRCQFDYSSSSEALTSAPDVPG